MSARGDEFVIVLGLANLDAVRIPMLDPERRPDLGGVPREPA